MSQENVEIMLQFADALGRHDLDLFLDLSDPDVEWHSSISVVAEGGAYHGHDGIRQYMRDVVEAFDSLEATVDRTLDVGDLVVGVGRLRYRGKTSGVESVVQMGWIYKFRGGKVIYLRAFPEPEQALEAAGLSE